MRLPAFMLKDKASIELYTGSSAYGNIYGTAVTDIKCRFEKSLSLIKGTKNGKSANKVGVCFFQPSVTVTEGSKITINSVVYEVLYIVPEKGFVDSHIEVVLGHSA
jgi:hypothetical protein